MGLRQSGWVRMGFRRLGQASSGGGGSITLIQGSSSIDVTGGTGPTATVAAKDNGVSNAKLAQAPANTIKGNNTGATANEADLTVAQVTTLLGLGTAAFQAATAFDAAGAAAAAQSASQPLDADLTAIAALTTTAYGRALLTLANQAALQTAAGLGTAAFQAATAFDAAGAAAAAQAASQPLDADLTAIAALSTTAYGRGLLTLASAVADAESLGSEIPTQGTNLTDANATITIAGGAQYVLPAATLTANRVLTLGVTGSPLTGEIMAVLRRGTEAFTLTVQDDAATVLFTMPASTKFAAYFRFSGTHFVLSSAVRIQ